MMAVVTEMEQPLIAFIAEGHESPAIEIRVNFGVFAGRAATPAEIDQLARWLLDEVPEITIVGEERHEINGTVEVSVHQVRIELGADRAPEDPAKRRELAEKLLERADYWARTCIAARQDHTAEL